MSSYDVETPPPPSAPPTVRRSDDERAMLLAFLADRDVHCPRCDYNLRSLSQPVCPECREELRLTVGVRKLQLHWLFITLAPGAFCMIAVGIFIVMSLIHGPPPPQLEIILLLLFLVASAATGVAIAVWHRGFLRLENATQCFWALAVWGFHLAVFAYMVLHA
jgi:hypothetical protein